MSYTNLHVYTSFCLQTSLPKSLPSPCGDLCKSEEKLAASTELGLSSALIPTPVSSPSWSERAGTGLNVSVRRVLPASDVCDEGWTESWMSDQDDTLVPGVVRDYVQSEGLIYELSASVNHTEHLKKPLYHPGQWGSLILYTVWSYFCCYKPLASMFNA